MPVLLLRMAKNEKNKYATANMPTLTIAKTIEMNSILSRVSPLEFAGSKEFVTSPNKITKDGITSPAITEAVKPIPKSAESVALLYLKSSLRGTVLSASSSTPVTEDSPLSDPILVYLIFPGERSGPPS